MESRGLGSCQVSAGGFEVCGIGKGKMDVLERLGRCFELLRRR